MAASVGSNGKEKLTLVGGKRLELYGMILCGAWKGELGVKGLGVVKRDGFYLEFFRCLSKL